MKLTEVKTRVESIIQPLIAGNVRLVYTGNGYTEDFEIRNLDYWDNPSRWEILRSDNRESFEYDQAGIEKFLSHLRRLDKQPIKAFHNTADIIIPKKDKPKEQIREAVTPKAYQALPTETKTAVSSMKKDLSKQIHA